MTSAPPMFPGWNTLLGRPSKSSLTSALEERRRLAGQGLPDMAALLDGWADPALLAPSAAGTGSRRRLFDTATTFHPFSGRPSTLRPPAAKPCSRCSSPARCERFIRTFKEECVWLHTFTSIAHAKEHTATFITYYNTQRFHQSLNYTTPYQHHQNLCRQAA